MSPLSLHEGLSIHREAPPSVEGLAEARDLSRHRTVFDLDLCEIVRNLVEALYPLQTTSKVHEKRMATLEAVPQSAHERDVGPLMIALRTISGACRAQRHVQTVAGDSGSTFQLNLTTYTFPSVVPLSGQLEGLLPESGCLCAVPLCAVLHHAHHRPWSNVDWPRPHCCTLFDLHVSVLPTNSRWLKCATQNRATICLCLRGSGAMVVRQPQSPQPQRSSQHNAPSTAVAEVAALTQQVQQLTQWEVELQHECSISHSSR